ncbi:MAG TPA: valine--tRNA ligase [Rhodothermia bacterium]|nr:valine--tRNA ligase [Rhodothermia bacterium]
MEETKSISTVYNPRDSEARIYSYWLEHGFFAARVDHEKPPFCVMMPPPNVTGRLHMGHALGGAVQDALTRMHRMKGFEALWMPGMDHAGIATQNVVERLLVEKRGVNRHDLGRKAFVDEIWKWKEEYGSIIIDQLKKLGASCDWDRTRFTMDAGFTRAVQTVFVKLYEDGLIYRGHYLVNWCPVDRTALSDEEVDNVEREGHLWHIRYPLADGSGSLTIATTRPETMLGDTAVAVHPEDDRYAHLIGKKLILPLVGREIPIIGDEYVKMEFAAGALKITPAHDPNDFEIGTRHGLEVLNIMNPDGTINDEGGAFAGLDRFVARQRIVEELERQGLLVKVEPYTVSIPISSRSKAVIEPLISRQWFVRMQPFAERAIGAVKDGDITFYPKRWENEYFRWLENIRDWTISRQLWWGHRIPVWYYPDDEGLPDESRDFIVSVDRPEPDMIQDEDVLDTWFSSWLWPFATLGWPEETEELEYFYPTQVLVSGYDILFFWIARMIMAGQRFTDKDPYKDIFITGMIKDKYGRWMSKSLGNGIDPLDMIEQYGADAVRFSLVVLCAQGQDIKLDPLKFEMGRNFANKIWNAFNVFGRYMETGRDYRRHRSFDELELVEKWMLHRLNRAIEGVDEAVSKYRLNDALSLIYDVFWHDYCDWYLELIKPDYGEEMPYERINLAVEIYEKLIQLLHPFMPFVTEELWTKIRPRNAGEACIVSAWPAGNPVETDDTVAEAFGVIQEMITGIRNVKSQKGVPPSREVSVFVSLGSNGASLAGTLERNSRYFERLSRASATIGTDLEKPAASIPIVVGRHQVFIPLKGLLDVEGEKTRLQKEIAQKEGFLDGVRRKLQNEQFLKRAPADVVAREQQKEQDAAAELEKLRENLRDLAQ